MRRARRISIFSSAEIAAMLCLAAAVVNGCNAHADQDKESPAAKAPASVGVENGRVTVTLDAESQTRLGIQTVALSASSVRLQVSAPAVVLSVQDLASLRNAYVMAQAQLEKARAKREVAEKEYQRLKNLYQDDQNASAKAMESAQGTLQGDKADENAAQEQLGLQAAVVRQQWGAAVAKWMESDAAALEQVLSQQRMLVQITLPQDDTASAPAAISLEVFGRRVPAKAVSAFPHVDPRIQGAAYLYVTSAGPGVVPGMNLIAHFATGKRRRGVVVPESAVVWSEAQAWIYVQAGANQFARVGVVTDTPVEKGFLVTEGLASGERVVVRGAQALLSEELLLPGQGTAAPDTDPD